MAKTYIGIDVDNSILRVVALEESGKELKTVALVQREINGTDETAAVVAELLRQWDSANARLAMTVPATAVLGRRLEFPFGDRRKITAAIPLELGSRLPVALDEHLVTALPPVAVENKFRTIGLALPKDEIASIINPFDEQQLPLRYLGVEPFSYAGQLKTQPPDCLLLSVRSDAVTVLLIENGTPAGYRISSTKSSATAADKVTQIKRDTMSLQQAAGRDSLPVFMFGPGLNEPLRELLAGELPAAEVPDETFEGSRLPAEFVPALLAARAAAAPDRGINLRQGDFAYRGSLAPFKGRLIAAALLLSIAFGALAAGAWLSYSGKAAVAEKLEQQMEKIYRRTFPNTTEVPKDIPLHMTSRLNAAREQSQLFGAAGAAPLQVLEAITRAMPEESTSIVRELSYDANNVRLAGQAASFESVDRLAAGLNNEALFSSVRISDAKTNIDGKKIDFRIEIDFAGKGGQ